MVIQKVGQHSLWPFIMLAYFAIVNQMRQLPIWSSNQNCMRSYKFLQEKHTLDLRCVSFMWVIFLDLTPMFEWCIYTLNKKRLPIRNEHQFATYHNENRQCNQDTISRRCFRLNHYQNGESMCGHSKRKTIFALISRNLCISTLIRSLELTIFTIHESC